MECCLDCDKPLYRGELDCECGVYRREEHRCLLCRNSIPSMELQVDDLGREFHPWCMPFAHLIPAKKWDEELANHNTIRQANGAESLRISKEACR